MKTIHLISLSVLAVSCTRRPDPPDLRAQITGILATNVSGHFSVYIEDLSSSTPLGVSEDESFDAWSLLKLVVGVTVLRRVEKGELSLDDTVRFTPELLAVHSTLPADTRPGNTVTIRTLLAQMISLSDNRASFALARCFNADAFQDALEAAGLPRTPTDRPRNELPQVSPKQYANLLRSLHQSGCLAKAHADALLQALEETVYTSQIPSGLPAGARVAHMVGYNANTGDFHDCGIVYHPKGAYILCVMSRNSTREEADRVISRIARVVYEQRTVSALAP